MRTRRARRRAPSARAFAASLLAALLLAARAAAVALPAPALAAARPTYVTITFDDGLASSFAHRHVLASRGMRATWYVSSSRLGAPGFMTWEQLGALADAGDEVGGHTLDHRALPPLDAAERARQVCDDRAVLHLRGFDVRSFAYPHGLQDAASRATVAACGYETARTTGGLDWPDLCCVFAERPRPPQPHALRAFMPRLGASLEVYQDLISRARDGGNGWVILVLHDLCVPGACDGFDEYAVDTGTLGALLDWVAADPRLRVRTVAEVLALGADATPPR